MKCKSYPKFNFTEIDLNEAKKNQEEYDTKYHNPIGQLEV